MPMQLPSIFENTLMQYVRGGGNVLIAAGTSAGHKARIPVFGADAGEVHDYARDGGYGQVGEIDLTHPAIHASSEADASGGQANAKAVTAADTSGWGDVKVFYAVSVDPAKARVVARLTDGTPLLMDKQIGEGHVLLLTSGMDNLTNDLPIHPVFVPFVDQVAHYLSGSDRLSGSRQVDSFVQLHTAESAGQGAPVEVIDPSGKRPLSLSEARSIQSFQLTKAGFYQIRFANGKDAVLGVNPDRRESDLAPMDADIQQLWAGAASGTQEVSEQGQQSDQAKQVKSQPYSIWWYIMILALAAAVAESIVASGYLGTQREEA